MKKFAIVFLAFLMVSSLPLSFGERLGPADAPLGVLRDFVISVKFLMHILELKVIKLKLHQVTKMSHLL